MDFARRRSRRRRFRSSKIFLYSKLSRYALIGTVVFVIFTAFLFIWYGRDLPQPGKLIEAPLGESTRIYDRKGILLYSVYQDSNRTYVKLSEIPESVEQATISIEDKDFYENQGFSVVGYLRAIRDLITLQGLSGGSTLTQQLVKNVLLSSERTIPRKIKELILSIQVDKRYSKDQILELYLNDVPYGGTAIGVEAAAETYFGKKVKDVTLGEAAFLAGLPQSPSVYSPFMGNKYYLSRTQVVLNQMVKEKYITKKQAETAYDQIKNYKFSQRNTSIKAPHFVMYVRAVLAERFGDHAVENGALQVTTSLDYKIQKQAEEIVKSEIDKLKGFNVRNGAVVVMDPKTGEILAMVGSKDYFDEDNDGNFNVTLANRQPGSSLKPVMYATAFEKGYTPSTLLMDVKTEFPAGPDQPMYIPVNYDGKYRGPVQVRFALGNSLNIPAVKMLARVGVKDTMQQGYEMGIKNWEPTSQNLSNVGLSLVLGGREVSLLEEVTAYGVLANKGVKQDPISILKVTQASGKKLFEFRKSGGIRVLSEEVSFLISQILLDNSARSAVFGPSSYLNISGKTVSVKTGTTDEKRDNWTVGYTPSFVAGVWVGNNDNSSMNQAISSGVTGASPIWNRIMTAVLKGKSDEKPTKPDNVIEVTIDALAGGLPKDGQPTRSEYFIKGTEPTSVSGVYKSKDGKNYISFYETDPVSTDGLNRWQNGIDAWIEASHKDDELYHPPSDIDATPSPSPTPTPSPSPSPSPTP